jgi:hypothetical protein
MKRSVRSFLLIFVALMAVAFSGCKTTEPENESARPWNSPRGWEGGGMPGYMPNYRR